MGLSEKFESASMASKVAVLGGLFVLAAAILWWEVGSTDAASNISSGPALAYYTVDDGVTWFKDKADLVPPFNSKGKTASQVVLFTAEGGKTQFAGYLQRFDAATKKRLDAGAKMPRTISGVEVKKPGAGGTWTARNSKAGMDIVNVKSPTGSGEPEMVTP